MSQPLNCLWIVEQDAVVEWALLRCFHQLLQPYSTVRRPTLFLLFAKEERRSEFFQFFKAVQGTLIVFTDDEADVVPADGCNNLW